jgi:hypothetical protein
VIAGSMRGKYHHCEWQEIHGAPVWMVAYNLVPARAYRFCWACLTFEPLEAK